MAVVLKGFSVDGEPYHRHLVHPHSDHWISSKRMIQRHIKNNCNSRFDDTNQ
jgi:hypothetical protein